MSRLTPAWGLISDRNDPDTPTSWPSWAFAAADMVGASWAQNSSAAKICVSTWKNV